MMARSYPLLALILMPLRPKGERCFRMKDIAYWGGAAVLPPTSYTGSLQELLAARAALTPEALAVASKDGRLTYCELHDRASRLARRLCSLGVGPEVRV